MRLALNESISSSYRTKPIKARYYFVKDKVEEGEVNIRYCPTKQMWSDILNKPKQGAPFRKDSVMLMNTPIDYNDRVEFSKTNPGVLPKGKKNDLGSSRIRRSHSPSRSVLGDIGNRDRPGILRNKTDSGVPGNTVSWSEVVYQ